MYYINNFFIFSILGYIMENITYLILNTKENSGIMYGPYTPVYGIGIIIVIIIYNNIKNTKLSKFNKVLLIFLISTILLTIIEYIGGITIEFFFHKRFWNYEKLLFNIGHYIALEISLIWGLCSIIYIVLIKSFTDKLAKKIPYYITINIMVLFIIDLIVTIINNIK